MTMEPLGSRLCPICRRPIAPVDWDAPFRPFCSPRCKAVDFGGWLDGRYRISRPAEEQEMNAGVAPAVEKREDEDESR